jgi:hypothetical protein
VNRKVAPDSVTGAVPVVEAMVPQWRTSERIKVASIGSCRKNGARKGKVSLENKRISFCFLGGGITEVNRAGGVGGAVKIVSSGIDKEKC